MTERNPDLDVVVLGGGGHVGLPLSLAFAQAGLRVGIYDTNQATLDRIARGEMPFMETGADELLSEILPTGRLAFGSDGSMIERTMQLVVVIGTPVDEFLGPSMTIFEKAVDQIAPHLRQGALVALRSTVYPGTTGYVAQHLAERGCVVDVAFCPERIAEGHALEELSSLPQIIGADTDVAAERAAALFGTLASKTIRTTTKEAELTKLFTNTWRYMKFAVANQFFMIADSAGVDYSNVLRAIRDDYPRAADLPGPGFAAGPCLFKDTMQLAAFTSDHFPLGQAAMQVNEGLPAYIVSALERRYGGLTGKTVGILGMAFKAELDDPRASLSYKLRKLLSWAGAKVLATDPYVQDERLVSLERVVDESDILVLGAPHKPYRSLKVDGKDVVDVWGALGPGIRLSVRAPGARWSGVGLAHLHRHRPTDFADLPPLATWDGRLLRFLPWVFAISTGVSVRNYVFQPATIGFDALLYTDATRSWLAGGDPWAVSRATIPFGAPPPTLLAFIPFAPMPDLLVILTTVIGSFVLAFLAIRALGLPMYWLFFWPIVDGALLGNPDVAVFALLVIARTRLAGLAPLLKIYAFLPLASMWHWKAIGTAVLLLVVTAPFLPWSLWVTNLPSITAGLERWSVTTSVAGSLPLMLVGIVALVALGYRRAGWLVVPVLWPFTQPHYLAMSIPVLTPTLAILWSIPGPPPLIMLGSVIVAAIGFRLFPLAPAASTGGPAPTSGHAPSSTMRGEMTARVEGA